MATSRAQESQVWGDAEEGEPLALLVGTRAGTATLGSRGEAPQQVRKRNALRPRDGTTGDSPEGHKDTKLKRYMHRVGHSSAATTARLWEGPQCPLTDAHGQRGAGVARGAQHLAPPSAQGLILEAQDRVPRRAPCMEPASSSACVSAPLSLSLSVSLMNK